MPFEFEVEEDVRREIIKVMGVGGGGGNAINRMVACGLKGVEFISLNTDGQALDRSQADYRVQLGPKITGRRGAGAKPEIGEKAAEESRDDIAALIKGSHMLFITAGMGGGTGTGAAHVIAQIAKEEDVLTVGIVTKPFLFEGTTRARQAEDGIAKLREHVDALITIPNEKLLQIVDRNTTMSAAFLMADAVLMQGVQGITDLVKSPGEINLDFSDISTILKDGGEALMGIGEASGDKRGPQAAQMAISSPLLEIPINGAKRVLLNFTGGSNMTLTEVNEAANLIREVADPEAQIIVGSAIDDNLGDTIRITVIATDFGPSRQNVTPGRSQSGAARGEAGTAGSGGLDLPDFYTRENRNDKPSFRGFSETPIRSNKDLPPFLQNKNLSDD
ncbi:MAG: cell division protein FtsZ [Peptococcaceae bacterium]|nr:cell division protein FtsZ [Peptococcaceae bacterium]